MFQNSSVQGMLNHLKEKKDVGFFTSIAGLMNSCSVLDLDAFERNTKAEGTCIALTYTILNTTKQYRSYYPPHFSNSLIFMFFHFKRTI